MPADCKESVFNTCYSSSQILVPIYVLMVLATHFLYVFASAECDAGGVFTSWDIPPLALQASITPAVTVFAHYRCYPSQHIKFCICNVYTDFAHFELDSIGAEMWLCMARHNLLGSTYHREMEDGVCTLETEQISHSELIADRQCKFIPFLSTGIFCIWGELEKISWVIPSTTQNLKMHQLACQTYIHLRYLLI